VEAFESASLNALLAGNLLLSFIGAAFAMSAPCETVPRHAKWCWFTYWTLIGFVFLFRLVKQGAFGLPLTGLDVVLFKVSRGGATFPILWMGLAHRGSSLSWKNGACALALGVVIASVVFDAITFGTRGGVALSCATMLLLAWRIRFDTIPASLVIVAYALLLLGLEVMSYGDDLVVRKAFVLLMVAKLSVIGAMYEMLGLGKGKEERGVRQEV
jgi:hypothetical protein